MTTRGNELAAMTAERNKVIQELAELKLSINALDLMDIPRMRGMRNHLIDQAKTNQDREGCVVKTWPEENDITIGRKILKSVSEEYYLRKDGTEYK